MQRRRTESFLLRIVVQDGDCPHPDQWRGRVQHIGTGIEHAFSSLDELIDLMNAHLVPAFTDYDDVVRVGESVDDSDADVRL